MRYQSYWSTHPSILLKVRDKFSYLNIILDPDHEIIALNFGKEMIKSFLANLARLMGIIKDRNGKILVPVVVQTSLLNPNTEVTVIMRTI